MSFLDPKPIIVLALSIAQRTNAVAYVYSPSNSFVATSRQPPPTQSHWRVHPDGKLETHIDADPKQTEYYYEEV